MKYQRHFESSSEAALSKTVQIRTLIADLGRITQILDCDIAVEEERAQVSDRSDGAYPILARALCARRDNLNNSIAVLEQRLATPKIGSPDSRLSNQAVAPIESPPAASSESHVTSSNR